MTDLPATRVIDLDAAGIPEVPIGVQEHLVGLLKERAREGCRPYTERFVDCSSGRFISTVWACRSLFNEMNACMHRYTGEEDLKKLKAQWVLEQKDLEKEKKIFRERLEEKKKVSYGK